jgi:hypothetical protein
MSGNQIGVEMSVLRFMTFLAVPPECCVPAVPALSGVEGRRGGYYAAWRANIPRTSIRLSPA